MATNVSFTRGPANKIATAAVIDGQVLYATDSKQLFVDQGSNRIQITDIIVVDSLPTDNVIVNKFYYVKGDNILAVYDGTKWVQINAQQVIATGSTPGTISVAGVDIPVNGLGNAAYASTDDFDAAGAAGAVIGSTDDSVDAHTVLGVRNRVDKAVQDITSQHNTDITALNTKIDNIEAGSSIIDSASLNGVAGTIDENKNVNLVFSVNSKGLSLSESNEVGLKLVPGNGLEFNGTGQFGMQIVNTTTKTHGAMTFSDKAKLDAIPEDAQANNIEHVMLNGVETAINPDTKTVDIPLTVNKGLSIGTNNELGLKLVPGNGIEYNAAGQFGLALASSTTAGAMSINDKKKIDAIQAIYSMSAPLSLTEGDLSIPPATASVDGYMTSTYATKLDGIEEGAQANVLDNVTFAGKIVSVTNKQADIPFSVKQECLSLGTNNELSFLYTPGNGLQVNADHSLGMTLATQSSSGAMSAADKQTLDTLANSTIQKYSTTIGDGTTTEFTITHDLNQPHVMISAFNNLGEGVWLEYKILNSTQIKVTFDTAPATNAITVVIIG